MENKDRYIYWKCGDCNSVHKSDKLERHKMDWCNCEKSALDAEEFYVRGVGNVIDITEEEYNGKQDR